MNKKILLLVLLLIVVAAATVAATAALFTDTETSGTNTFTAGTLNMTVGGADGTAFESFSISNIGADGTVSGGKTWTVTNDGSVDGQLAMSITGLTNTENDCNEPEAIVDTTCGDPGTGDGELGAAIATTLLVDRDSTGSSFSDETVHTSDLATASQAGYATAWNTYAAALGDGYVAVDAGASVDVTLNWATTPASYTNVIQSDSVTFTVQFDLTQVTPS